MTRVPTRKGRLLIYAPVPLHGSPDNWFIEKQAANGLRLWAENFDHVTVMMPLDEGPTPVGWVPHEMVGPNLSRIEIVPLPTAWTFPKFAKAYRTTRDKIRAEITRADFISFSIGGLIGDWGSVACLQAHAMGRPFGVWTDRIESEVIRIQANQGRLRSRLKKHLVHRPMAMLERYVIRRSTIGLFHGQQTYDAYAPYSSNPQIVHDIHVAKEAHITDAAFAAKTSSALTDPLQIVYAGRAAAMKGPLDWATALRHLAASGHAFEAHWLGDGPMLEDLRVQLQTDGLLDRVVLHGFVDDAEKVSGMMQNAHVFLFCHTTPESPRCLIESLIAGTPIVGYDGSYAADLISTSGGGHLIPIGNATELGDVLVDLANNREKLVGLIEKARDDGKPFDDVSVFEHRSDLIKEFLGGSPSNAL